jgi:hypothetical protein
VIPFRCVNQGRCIVVAVVMFDEGFNAFGFVHLTIPFLIKIGTVLL